MEALILCGMPAAGKTATAEIIAEKLGIEMVGGGDMLKEMANDRGYEVSGSEWWDTPEGMKFLKERKGNPDFDKEADRRLIKRINKGNIVVTSYTMAWLSKKGTKCWLNASADKRAERMSQRDSIPISKAKKVVKARDRENYALYKKMYGIELGVDMKPFNIVVDVNNKTAEQVADEIILRSKSYKKK